MNNINFLFVTLFGIGKLKKIPGSYASLVTTIFLFFLFHILKFFSKYCFNWSYNYIFYFSLCSKYFYKRLR